MRARGSEVGFTEAGKHRFMTSISSSMLSDMISRGGARGQCPDGGVISGRIDPTTEVKPEGNALMGD